MYKRQGLLTGNMGVSYVSGKDVFGTFVSKLPATLLLTALSIGATVIISIPLGIWAAVRHDRFTAVSYTHLDVYKRQRPHRPAYPKGRC